MSDAGASGVGDDLRYELIDGIARITLNRPDAGNALTPDQRDRLIDLFLEASADLRVRVVVLGAAGTHFCTGADLRAPRNVESPRPDGAPERTLGDVGRMIKRGAQRLVTSILDCEKPVIAAVNGTAAGIGAHIALACDLIVAAESARFIEVFVRRGITPDGGGAYLLPRMIGLAKAKELVFLGDDLSAADAERIGLINKVVPAGRPRQGCRRLGRAAGEGSDEGDLALEVAAQPIARLGPRRRIRRRGMGAGARVAHRGLRRGRAGVRRPPRRRVPRLVINLGDR